MPVRSHGEFVGMEVSKNILSCERIRAGNQRGSSRIARMSFLSHHFSH